MLKLSLRQRAGQWLAVAALLSFVGMGVALAQAEPTMKQIYDAAQSGKIEQAQTMVQQVLISHPNSAKAHFVQAELFAKQGDASRSREALVRADKLAPGLPFAKPEAVQALRSQLASKPGAPALKDSPNRVNGANATSEAAPAAPSSSFPIGLGLALGGGAIALVIFLMRKKPAAQPLSQTPYANQGANSTAIGSGLGGSGGPSGSGGLSGPQTFGNAGSAGNGMSPGYGQPGNAQPGYGQPSYGQPGQPGYGQPAAGGMGMGGRVMGGLATGLAVGAGVMAAQAIGKNLMGNNNEHTNNHSDNSGNAGNANNFNNNANNSLPGNSDLGGQNFGVNDTGSWDDGGSASADSGDGGGDWDA